MSKVITQETFDECVNQNIEDFDMSPEEAVKDAIEQFETMGVDLSNIVKTAPSDRNEEGKPRHVVLEAIQTLHQFIINKDLVDTLKDAFEVINQTAASEEKNIITTNEGVQSLIDVVKALDEMNSDSLNDSLNCLSNVLSISLETKKQGGKFSELSQMLMTMMEKYKTNYELIESLLKTVYSLCYKCEKNKKQFCQNNFLKTLAILLNQYESYNDSVLIQVLYCMNTFCRDDDITDGTTQAFANSVRMCDDHKLHLTCYNLLKSKAENDELLPILCQSIGVIAAKEEYCKDINKQDGTSIITLLINIMNNHMNDKAVINNTLNSLIRLVRSDENKKMACENRIFLDLLLRLLDHYKTNNNIICGILQVIAGVTLRQPEHVHEIMETSLGTRIVGILSTHMDNPRIIKHSCIALRNLVSRTPEYRSQLLINNCEATIRTLHTQYPDLIPYTFAALRDLGCDIEGMTSKPKTVVLGVGGEIINTEDLE